MERLLGFLDTGKPHVTAEALIQIKDLLRRYPAVAAACLSSVSSIAPEVHASLTRFTGMVTAWYCADTAYGRLMWEAPAPCSGNPAAGRDGPQGQQAAKQEFAWIAIAHLSHGILTKGRVWMRRMWWSLRPARRSSGSWASTARASRCITFSQPAVDVVCITALLHDKIFDIQFCTPSTARSGALQGLLKQQGVVFNNIFFVRVQLRCTLLTWDQLVFQGSLNTSFCCPVQDAPYLLEPLCAGFAEEPVPVRLALLAAVGRLFFARAPECRALLGAVLAAALADANQDVHDRGLMYYRCASCCRCCSCPSVCPCVLRHTQVARSGGHSATHLAASVKSAEALGGCEVSLLAATGCRGCGAQPRCAGI